MTTHLANAQKRLRVHMTTAGGVHATYFHFLTTVADADCISTARAVCNAIKPLIATNASFDSADVIAAGSNVSNPVTWGTAITGTGGGAASTYQDPYYIAIAGRTTSGCRTRLFFYGFYPSLDNNWRIEGSESTVVAAVVTALNTVAAYVVALDGLQPTWKNYFTMGANRHHIRRRHSLGG